MKITVERLSSNGKATTSTVFIDDEFECYGLEDEHRDVKVAGETRIPEGEYAVKVKNTGGFHSRYTDKFGAFHKGMLHVQDVPNFTDILIHIGNKEADTAGCLLVGQGVMSSESDHSVLASKNAYKALYAKVIQAAIDGDLWIEYVDQDR